MSSPSSPSSTSSSTGVAKRSKKRAPARPPAPKRSGGGSMSSSRASSGPGASDAELQGAIRRDALALSRGSQRQLLSVSGASFSREDMQAAWSEHTTGAGATYFFNKVSKKTTWDPPTDFALQESRRKAGVQTLSSLGSWFWVQDEILCFAAALKDEASSTLGAFRTLDGRSVTVDVSQGVFGSIADVDRVNKDVDDMVKMDVIDDAWVLHNLRLRCERDEYFTNVGSILVSLNPFKWIDRLYTREQFRLYQSRSVGEDVPPHFFDISDNAYRGLRDENRSQSIIISGESGSGKTEATKKCLQYLADVAGSELGLEHKLLATNPILEAFGNAKTVRNGNSSRFGKWTVVRFDGQSRISGGEVVNYLLEKSRVVVQMAGERNFHIFYQLLQGASEEQRAQYRLPQGQGCAAMKFLRSGGASDVAVDGVDDAACLRETLAAMRELDFSAEDEAHVFRIVAGVMWLGNIDFETPVGGTADDACQLKLPASEAALQNVCALLALDREALQSHVMNRIRSMGGQTIKSPLSARAATESCAALAKEVYGRLFDWLVQRINATLVGDGGGQADGGSHGGSNGSNTVGVLDIFGFEIFETNSFEQLCINFTNEKLQQHFNDHTFKTETHVYETQGIAFDPPHFKDNADVLELLEQRPRGVLVLLDEECVLPRGSDASFANKLVQYHNGSHERFSAGPKLRAKSKSKLAFAVDHYAGVVVYEADGFLSKNKDDLRHNLVHLAQSSAHPLMQRSLFPHERVRDDGVITTNMENGSGSGRSGNGNGGSGGNGGNGARRHKTQAGFFRRQLDALMAVLASTEPHYIRCIKSNNDKAADRFDPFLCHEQLRYSGVFEAIEIRKQGFPFRRLHEHFFQRYRCVVPDPDGDGAVLAACAQLDGPGRCKRVLQALVAAPKEATDGRDCSALADCRTGSTMMLYKAPQHVLLESLREAARQAAVVTVGRVVRGFLARKRVARFRQLRAGVEAAMRSRDVAAIEEAVERVERVERAQASAFSSTSSPSSSSSSSSPSSSSSSSWAPSAATLGQRLRADCDAASALLQQINDELEVCRSVEELQGELAKHPNAAATHFEEMEALLERCEELDMASNYAHLRPVLDSFEARVAGVRELIHAKRDLKESTSVAYKPDLVEAVRKAEALTEAHGDFCAAEIAAAKAMLNRVVQEAKFVDALVAGMENGGPKGSVGRLDTASINAKALREAWTDAKSMRSDAQTPRAKALTDFAERLIALREAVRDNDWDGIEGLVARMDELQAKGDVERFHLPDAEVALYKGELNCFTITSELASSVAHGAVRGEPGALDTSEATVEHLRADIEDARCLECAAPVAKAVVDAAEQHLRLRQAVVKSDWGSVKQLLADGPALPAAAADDRYAQPFAAAVAAERTLIVADQHGRAIVERAVAALGEGRVTGAVGSLRASSEGVQALDDVLKWVDDNVQEKGEGKGKGKGKGGPTKQSEAVLEVVEAVRQIRSALLAVNVDDAGEAKLEPSNLKEYAVKRATVERALATATEQRVDGAELELVLRDVLERECVQALTESVRAAGRAAGKVGSVETSSVDAAPLDEALRGVAHWHAESPAGKKAHAAVEALAGLRRCVRNGDWDAVERTLHEQSEALLADFVDEEATLMQEELNNRTIVAELTRALSNGNAKGSVGALDVAAIDTDSLRQDIADAKELGCKTKEARELMDSAAIVLELRDGLVRKDWAQVESALRASQFKSIHDAAKAEVEVGQKELNDRTIQHGLEHALQSGAASGELEHLRVDTVTFHVLDDALAQAQKLRCESEKARALAAACKTVRAGRAALSEGRFLQLGPLVEDAERQGLLRVAGHEEGLDETKLAAVAPASAELTLLRDKFVDESLRSDVGAALGEGRPSGPVGALDLSTVKLGELLKVTERVGVVETKTEAAAQYVRSARAVAALREALLSGPDWDAAAALAGSAECAQEALVSEAQAEVLLVQDEVEHRSVLRLLKDGLATGPVKGTIGALDLDGLSVDALNKALAAVKTMARKTPEAVRLYSTALAMRDVRVCVLGTKDPAKDPAKKSASASADKEEEEHWLGAVQVALDAAQGVGVAELAKEELRLVQDHVDDMKIRRELCAALAQGAPLVEGRLGRADPRSCDVERLALALSCAHTLVCKTERAKKLEKTAQLVLVLRRALVQDGDGWAHVAGLLESKLDVSIEGGAPPDSFRQHCDEAAEELQSLIDECRERAVAERLQEALGQGGAEGAVGSIVVSNLDVEALDAVVAFAERAGPRLTDGSREAAKVAQAVRQLREGFMHGGKEQDEVDTIAKALASLPPTTGASHGPNGAKGSARRSGAGAGPRQRLQHPAASGQVHRRGPRRSAFGRGGRGRFTARRSAQDGGRWARRRQVGKGEGDGGGRHGARGPAHGGAAARLGGSPRSAGAGH